MVTTGLVLDDRQQGATRRLAVALADHQEGQVRQVDLTSLPWLNGRDNPARTVVLDALRAGLESRTARREQRLTIRPVSDRLRSRIGIDDGTVVMLCAYDTPEGEVATPAEDMWLVWLGAHHHHSTDLYEPPTVEQMREEDDRARRIEQVGLADGLTTAFLDQMLAELRAHGRPSTDQGRTDFSYHMRLAKPHDGSAGLRMQHLLAAWALVDYPKLNGPKSPA